MVTLAHGHHDHRDHEHHAGHRHFDPEFFLSMEERRRDMLPPEQVLEDFLADDSATLADIGAGTGFFALPAARRLRAGTVYAVDRQADMLEVVRRRTAEADLSNLVPVQANATAIPLGDGSVDAVLMANVFHDIEDRSGALREVSRILRPGGSFYLVEWEANDSEIGPPKEIRIAQEDLAQALETGGFAVERRFPGPSPFYRMLARKK